MTVDSWCHCCDWQVTRRAAFDAEAAVYSSYVAHYAEHSWRQRRHSVILVWLLAVYDGDDTRGSHIRQTWKHISHLDRGLNSNNFWCSRFSPEHLTLSLFHFNVFENIRHMDIIIISPVVNRPLPRHGWLMKAIVAYSCSSMCCVCVCVCSWRGREGLSEYGDSCWEGHTVRSLHALKRTNVPQNRDPFESNLPRSDKDTAMEIGLSEWERREQLTKHSSDLSLVSAP